MNNQINYCLDENLKLDIIKVKNIILSKLNSPQIFLFGSIAKGCYSKYSDIDLLVLIHSNKTPKELRVLRHSLEDSIGDIHIQKEVDIKLYSIDRYNELCNEAGFEKSILQDLVDIRSW